MSRQTLQDLGDVPFALRAASAALAARTGVAVTGPWGVVVTPTGTRWGLPVRLSLLGAVPAEHVPSESEWVVTVAPDDDVRLYPSLGDGGFAATFPHQNHNRCEKGLGVRSGQMCTATSTHRLAQARAADYDEPADLYERVGWHVERGLEWLRDAATGGLTRAGDPFEVPDFKTPRSRPGTLAVHESRETLAAWQSAPRAGLAEVAVVGDPTYGALVVQAWLDGRGRDVLRPPWGTVISAQKGIVRAVWVRLDALPVRAPWQAPASGAELLALAEGQDLRALLRPLWRHLRGQAVPFLIVGAPIPERWGEAPSVMHWQGLHLPPFAKEKARTRALRDHQDYARALPMNTSLPWIQTTENWHPDVVENRGRLSLPLRGMRAVLVGTGALGSLLADVLVRMGLHDLVLIDPDRYEAGNGVRHRLGLLDIGHQKAPALAARLNEAGPSARVRGYAESLPSSRPEIVAALAEADLVLDCTASDELMRALSGLGLREDARIVSASVGLHAERLYVYGDRADAFSAEAFDTWFGPYRSREHARSVAEGLPQAAGCWHPVTPVPYHRLVQQVGALTERLEHVVARPEARIAEALGLKPSSVIGDVG